MILAGKTIVVTGAARGLGAAMSKRLAGQGCRLALVDLDGRALANTEAQLLSETSADIKSYQTNITDEDQVVTVFSQIASDFGAIHGLVNNAGITKDALLVKFKNGELISKMSLQQWQAVVDVNLTGVFLCAREAATHMVQLDCKGCIINISSISRHGNVGQTNYTASKAGVQAMTVTWAKELARYGIRSVAIAPGFIATDMVLSMKDRARELMTANIPAKRLGEPDEIARTVQFILENEYVNGRCIGVDGALRL